MVTGMARSGIAKFINRLADAGGGEFAAARRERGVVELGSEFGGVTKRCAGVAGGLDGEKSVRHNENQINK